MFKYSAHPDAETVTGLDLAIESLPDGQRWVHRFRRMPAPTAEGMAEDVAATIAEWVQEGQGLWEALLHSLDGGELPDAVAHESDWPWYAKLREAMGLLVGAAYDPVLGLYESDGVLSVTEDILQHYGVHTGRRIYFRVPQSGLAKALRYWGVVTQVQPARDGVVRVGIDFGDDVARMVRDECIDCDVRTSADWVSGSVMPWDSAQADSEVHILVPDDVVYKKGHRAHAWHAYKPRTT